MYVLVGFIIIIIIIITIIIILDSRLAIFGKKLSCQVSACSVLIVVPSF